MSGISDGLREQAKRMRNLRVFSYKDPSEYEHLAGRIDSETAELPLSADGRPIHPGDVTYYRDGSEFLVAVMKLTDCGWMVYRPGDHVSHSPGDLYHERPDVLSLIANDLDELKEEFRTADGDAFFALSVIVERIRALAGKGDGR